LKAAVQSEKLSRQISEVSTTPRYTTTTEPLLIITPSHNYSSQKSSSSLTPTIDHYNRLKGVLPTGGAISANIKSNLPKSKISEESDALRVAKKRDLREMIDWLKFDNEFYQMANNCEQALNECEKVLLTLKETPNLSDQIELNEQLNLRMEDIYPDIDQTDHMTSTAIANAPNQKAKTAATRVSSLLYDRWETVRVRLATRQNLLEIQILEDEQYKRMVEGYKSEQSSPI